jgi:transcriptional regulator with XRE-family HTH domain/quercetin dioxygenase-like cupin family protein
MRVAELAREVGVTPSLISQIERGLSRPSVSTLFAIAQALDVPVDAFFREPPSLGAPDEPGVPAGDVASAGHGEGPPPAGSRPGTGQFVPEAPVTDPAAPERAVTSDADPAVTPDLADSSQTRLTGNGRYKVHRGGRAVNDIQGGVRWERLTRITYDHLDFFELVYQPGAQSHPQLYTHPGTEMVLVMSGCLEITVGFEHYRLEPGDSIDFPSSMPHRYMNPGAQTARAVTVILYDCPAEPGQSAAPHSPSR